MYIIEGVSEVEQWMKHHLWKAMKVNLSYKYMTTVGSKSGALVPTRLLRSCPQKEAMLFRPRMQSSSESVWNVEGNRK